jgi:hypothetical protein
MRKNQKIKLVIALLLFSAVTTIFTTSDKTTIGYLIMFLENCMMYTALMLSGFYD